MPCKDVVKQQQSAGLVSNYVQQDLINVYNHFYTLYELPELILFHLFFVAVISSSAVYS